MGEVIDGGAARTVTELEAVREASPDAYEALLDALAYAHASTVDPQLLVPAKRRLAVQFGCYEGPAVDECAGTPLEQAAADLFDQFVVHVAGVDDDLRTPLEEARGIEELNEFAKALYVLDAEYRLRFLLRALLASGDGPLAPLPSREPSGDRSRDAALKELWREATRLADVDVEPEIIEQLRLRCAWYHQCHTCLSGRSAVDGELLVDDAAFEKVKDYESSDLSERSKTMLRLVDAYLVNPQDGLDDGLRAQLLEHFTPAQLVALLLKVVGYTSQKMTVMLGTDLPIETENGLLVTEHHDYITFIADDDLNLPTTKRRELRQLAEQASAA